MPTTSGTIVSNSSYYYNDEFTNKTFYNTLIAASVAVETHFGTELFHDDLTRLVYSQNAFCFRDRMRKSKESVLDIPFMNYYLKSISKDTNPRSLWNNVAQVQGLMGEYESLLGYKLKLIPVTMEFESTAFFSQPFDALYAQQRLNYDQGNESIIYAYYTVPVASGIVVASGVEYQLKVPMFLNFDPVYNEEYSQSDWLETNKIFTIGTDFNIVTFFIYSDDTNISLTKETILNFVTSKNIDKNIDPVNYEPKELWEIMVDQYENITETDS